MKKIFVLLAVLMAAPLWAADERAKTDRSTRTHTILAIDSVTGEIRQIKILNGNLLVDVAAGAVSLAGPATVDQGASGASTDPWPFSVSRRSDGVEFGLAASPFGTRLFDGAGAAVGTIANPWIIGGQDAVSAIHPIRVSTDGTLTLLFNVSLGDDLTDTGGLRADTGGNHALHVVPHLWDGGGWDRAPGNSADGALVNLGTNNDVTVPGVATEAKQDTGNTSLASIDGKDFATETTLAAFNSKAVTLNTGAVVILTFPDNEPFDVAQIAGTTTSVNSGSADAGTQRMILADDQDPVTTVSRRPTEELKFASATIVAEGAVTIKTAVSGKKIVIAYLVSSFSVSSGTAKAEGVIHFGARGIASEWFPFDYPNFGGDTIPWPMGNEPKNETANEPVVIQVDDMDGNGPRLKVTIAYREVD